MCSSSVTKATLGRVPHYLKFLKELPDDGFEYISATHIARELELGEVQVRKDLKCDKRRRKAEARVRNRGTDSQIRRLPWM